MSTSQTPTSDASSGIFAAEEGTLLHRGEIVYVQADYAFNFAPQQTSDCSVLIGYLELTFLFSEQNLGHATQICGFHEPPPQWTRSSLCIPQYFSGRLLLFNTEIEEGDIVRLSGTEAWKTSYDPTTAWVCIGDLTRHKDENAVEFATNSVAVILRGELKSLWLKPSFQ